METMCKEDYFKHIKKYFTEKTLIDVGLNYKYIEYVNDIKKYRTKKN